MLKQFNLTLTGEAIAYDERERVRPLSQTTSDPTKGATTKTIATIAAREITTTIRSADLDGCALGIKKGHPPRALMLPAKRFATPRRALSMTSVKNQPKCGAASPVTDQRPLPREAIPWREEITRITRRSDDRQNSWQRHEKRALSLTSAIQVKSGTGIFCRTY